jgi:hypothetical protein
MDVSQFRPPLFLQSTETGRLRFFISPRVIMVELLETGVEVSIAGAGPEPGGPTGAVRFETAMVLHVMDSKVSVTVRGTVVPPRPWLRKVVFLGAGPAVGTGRGGAVEGGTTDGSVDGDGVGVAMGEREKMGKVGWIIGSER